MATNNESPHSSLEGSYGTPDTRLTSFSPEDARSKGGAPLGTPHNPAVPHDPFVSAQKVKVGSMQLSPTAPDFVSQTLNVAKLDPIPGSADHLKNIIANAIAPGLELIESEVTSSGMFTTNTLKTRNLRISSLLNRDVMHVIEVSLVDLEQSGYKLKGARRIASAGASIFLKLDNIDDVAMVHPALQVSGDLSIEFITAGEFAQIVSPQSNTNCSAYEGQVVLRVPYMAKVPGLTKKQFGETIIGLLQIDGELCAWKRYADPGSFHLIAEFADMSVAPRAVARLNGQPIGNGQHVLSVTLHQPDLPGTGAVTRYQSPTQTPTRRSDVLDLSNAMSNLNFGGGGMSAGFSPIQVTTMNGIGQAGPGYMVMAPTYPQNHQGFFHTQLPMGTFTALPTGFSYTLPGLSMNQMHFGSPQDHRQYGYDNSPVTNRDSYGYRRNNQHRALTPGRNRGHNSINNHHNVVEVERIRVGSDVRTTVMLRNIPNKVDQAMLKAIIDESSFGRYDFLYLRIDFSNNCNVGYAFINFVDPLDIIQFVEARANKPWDSFKSDKIAEVSYATIQGRDCLIQKFRNSSVMLEPPHYRPKLFFTFNDSFGRVGEEDEFPASDNASKLKRSCENAEHVGLFAPSAGQHMRDEQRRRRSQYDRGTSLAAREECEYDPFTGYSPY